MQHLPTPAQGRDAALHERPQRVVRRPLDHADIGAPGDDDAHVDPTRHRVDHRAAQPPIRQEVRVLDQHALPRGPQHVHVRAPRVRPLSSQGVLDEAHVRRAPGLAGGRGRSSVSVLARGRGCGIRGAARAQPRPSEHTREIRDDGSRHAAVHVVPAHAAVDDRGVVVRDVQPAGERDRLVDDDDLAVIAMREAKPPPPERDRVERDHGASSRRQVADERVRQAERADRVVDHAHLDARARAHHQYVLEPGAGVIGRDDVGLEADRVARGRERVEHGREGLATVAEHGQIAIGPPLQLRARVRDERGRQAHRDRARRSIGCGLGARALGPSPPSPAAPRHERYSTLVTVYSRSPRGTFTITASPARLPSSARATGESMLMNPRST